MTFNFLVSILFPENISRSGDSI